MAGRLEWHGDQFKKDLNQATAERLEAAAAILQATIVKSIRISYRTQGASKPGEPPHARTGMLMKSIFYEVNQEQMYAIVGTNLDYGLYLELGTHKMAARPYFRPALAAVRGRLERLGVGGSFGTGQTYDADSAVGGTDSAA